MKIALIYFNSKRLPKERLHHAVTDSLMDKWVRYYKSSGTTLQPVLLTDKQTVVPDIWPGEVAVIEDSEPPNCLDVLQKVGWMKAQAYKILGRCVVMDLDAIPIRSLDPLTGIDCHMAMSPDFGPHHQWDAKLPEVGMKHNAGVMVFNSPVILPMFTDLWQELWTKWKHITFFDELLFTIINHRIGIELPIIYNMPPHENEGVLVHYGARVIHFSGPRKRLLHLLEA